MITPKSDNAHHNALTCDTGAHGQVPISGLNSRLVSSAKDLPRLMQPTSFQEFSMVQPTRSPNTRLVFMARNLSLMEAQSAMGEPDIAMTRRTMDLERGITARRPALAAPAPGPKLKGQII
jgi:hypothetical protein